MVDGTKFWISFQRLAFDSILSRKQLIQKSAPSTIVWRQCDIRIGRNLSLVYKKIYWSPEFVSVDTAECLNPRLASLIDWDLDNLRHILYAPIEISQIKVNLVSA